MPTFVLLHSPLLDPSPAACCRCGETVGTNAVVPTLGSEGVSPPFWKRHAEAVAESLLRLPHAERIVLTAHSGAGPLLPAVRRQVEHDVVGYVFV
ncbi:MAG TPA: alpha/beta hydrolase, partial [bacterium]|nr:alpha/beta hydrolase [bacterium]